MKRLLSGLLAVLIGLFPAFAAAETALKSRASEHVVYDSPLSAGLDLQYSTLSYAKLADKNSNGVHIALEWIPFGDLNIGKLGLGFGIGYHLIKSASIGTDRVATISALPLELFVSYRFDYFRRQVLVPFVKAGVSLTGIKQKTERGPERDGWYGFAGLDLVGGVELSLSALEPRAARSIDRNHGINDVYIVFEYQKTSRLQQTAAFDLSHQEFRLGLRFEM